MGEFLYHPYPMSHVDLRELAFQMRSEELRKYGQDVLRRDPSRIAPAEVLDLMAYLVACDFVGAEAKCNTIKFKFKGTPVATSASLLKVDNNCSEKVAFPQDSSMEETIAILITIL